MARKAGSEFWQRLDAIQQSRLPPQHKLLLIWLWKYGGDNGECFPKQKQLATDMSLSKRQVIRLLSELSGLVTVCAVGTRNRYSIDWEALPDAEPVKPKGDTHDTKSERPKVTPTTPKGDTSDTNKVTPMTPSSSYVNHKETPKKPQGLFEEIPEVIDTPEFRAAWEEWHAFRRKKRWGKWIDQTRRVKLRELAAIGPERAVECIEHSVGNGYQGLFPGKFKDGSRNGNGGGGSNLDGIRAFLAKGRT